MLTGKILPYPVSNKNQHQANATHFQDPYLTKERYQIYSGTIQHNENGEYNFKDQFYLVPHEPIRYLTHLVQASLAVLDLKKAWKARNFFKFYDMYVRTVHDHHENEEEMMFPKMRQRLQELKSNVQFPQNVSDQHEPLMKILSDITDLGKQVLSKAKSASEIEALDAQLREKVNTMAQMMNDHLNQEESDLAPAMAEVGDEFMRQLEIEIVEAVQKKPDQEAVQVFLGSIIKARCDAKYGWGNDTENEIFLSTFPPEVRESVLPVFIEQYESYKKLLLDLNNDNEPAKPKKNCCF